MKAKKLELFTGMAVLTSSIFVLSCHVTEVPPDSPVLPQGIPIAFGRVHTTLTGSTTRWYRPELKFFELVNLKSNDRIKVDVDSADSPFFVSLPAGKYELRAIQIGEGPFRAMAALNPTFTISPKGLNYLGRWEVKVHPPTYLRLVDISVENDLKEAKAEIVARHPDLADQPIATHLPGPQKSETRLVERSPYPRVWWFCRHQTC